MTPARVAINGFGRMGRLALRAGWTTPDLEFVHVNELDGGPETAAHLLTFDSVHGRWPHDARLQQVVQSLLSAPIRWMERSAPLNSSSWLSRMPTLSLSRP